jgi:hypothetical protein
MKLELRQYDLGKHSIPEHRRPAHGGKAKGKVKLFAYAHHWYPKLSLIKLICKHNS